MGMGEVVRRTRSARAADWIIRALEASHKEEMA